MALHAAALVVASLVPQRQFSGHSLSRRAAIGTATTALSAPAFALESKKPPDIKALVAALEASTPRSARNAAGDLQAELASAQDDEAAEAIRAAFASREKAVKEEFFPRISFEGSQGQGKKVVFTVNHENLSPPFFSAIVRNGGSNLGP